MEECVCAGSLIGSLAITVSHGILGSPAPDRLIADTLNSYAAPSNTSFTACFVSVKKDEKVIISPEIFTDVSRCIAL